MKDKKTKSDNLATPLVEIFTEVVKMLVDVTKELLKLLFKWLGKKFFNSEDDDVLITKKAVLSTKTTIEDNTIGWSASHNKAITFDDYQEGHSVVLGSTGTGKTNFFYLIMDYAIGANCPVMWFDPKSGRESILDFIAINTHYERDHIIFSETEYANAKFNPLKNMNDSQILSVITNSFEWSDGEARYYKDRTIDIIGNEVLSEIRKLERVVSLYSIFDVINEKFRCKEVSGFMSQLTILIKSPFGNLFNDEDDTALTMLDIIESKKSLYVGVSAQGYGAISRSLAKILLSELQVRSHELGLSINNSQDARSNPIYLLIDEAEALLYKEFINLLNKGRSSGFRITLATQTYSDFDSISKDFTKQVKTNCSNLFVFNLGNDKDGYEDISKTIGTLKDIKTTKSTENGEATERGSERDVLRYIAHPQIAKLLPKGSCFYVKKFPHKTYAIKVKDSKTLKSLARKTTKARLPFNRESENPRLKQEKTQIEYANFAIKNSKEFNTSSEAH
jgi:hypothetical protein